MRILGRTARTTVLAAALLLIPVGLLACSSGESKSGSVSASGAPEPGVVKAKPSDATQVDVVLREFSVATQPTIVKAGNIYFLVANEGPEDAHEFVIVKTDLTADKLPIEKDKVPEKKIKIIGEIEPFAVKTKASDAFKLEAGHYVLICNITEIEDGKPESHYREGMRTEFIVQ